MLKMDQSLQSKVFFKKSCLPQDLISVWIYFVTLISLINITQAVTRDLILVAGGQDKVGEQLASVELWNGTDWTKSLPLNTARYGASMATDGTKAWISGGFNYQLGTLASVERFDLTQNGSSWTACKPMRTARELHCSALHQGYLYAMGGLLQNGSATASAERYNTVLDRWESLPPTKAARVAASAVSYGDALYLVGGYNQHGHVTPTHLRPERYEVSGSTRGWQLLQPMPHLANGWHPVSGVGVSYYGAIYLLGVQNVTKAGRELIDHRLTLRYALQSDEWSPSAVSNMELLTGRRGFCAVTIREDDTQKIVLIGGQVTQQYGSRGGQRIASARVSQSVVQFSFDAPSHEWSGHSNLTTARTLCACAKLTVN